MSPKGSLAPFDLRSKAGQVLKMKIDQGALPEICERPGIARVRLFGSQRGGHPTTSGSAANGATAGPTPLLWSKPAPVGG